MSKGAKRNLDAAIAEALAFQSQFNRCFTRWEVAGSVRRGKAEVGDIEHVIIPAMKGDVNLLWSRLEAMLPVEGLFPKPGIVTKAVYSNGTNRWGPKYRGVMFNGFRHEIFLADDRNWGAILTIRTGPASFSEMMVTDLRKRGMRQEGGYVMEGNDIVNCPDERMFFQLCGVPYCEPRQREAVKANG